MLQEMFRLRWIYYCDLTTDDTDLEYGSIIGGQRSKDDGVGCAEISDFQQYIL